MDKTGIFPVQNNASNLAGVMISVVDTTTTTKRPIILRNNVYGNFIPSSFPSRKSFHDEASIDRKGKRKIVNEIDFFSSEKRKLPRLEPGPRSLSIPQIKEEDITLQVSRFCTFMLLKNSIIFIVQNLMGFFLISLYFFNESRLV